MRRWVRFCGKLRIQGFVNGKGRKRLRQWKLFLRSSFLPAAQVVRV
jgi:hypothetical protein